MKIDDLISLLTVILTVSLATERCVAILKAALPWLATENRTVDGSTDLPADRSRRLVVQGVAVAASWLIAGFMAGDGTLLLWDRVDAGGVRIPAPILGLLGSGGSAFWTQLLQLVGEVKKTAAVRRADATMVANATAEELGLAPAAGQRTRLRAQLGAQAPERLDAALAGSVP